MLTKRDKARKLYKQARAMVAGRARHSTPVFIFGEMRSGTNMLLECMDRSRDTEVFNETDDEAFDGYELRSNEVIEKLIQNSPATHVVFKTLADSARAAELLRYFAEAKAIWIYRRYQDVVNSALRKWNEHNRYLQDILHDRDRARWRATNISEQSLMLVRAHYERGISEASARALIWYIRNRPYFEQELDRNAAVRLLNYEYLVSNAEHELASVFGFIGLPFRGSYIGHVSSSSVARFVAPVLDDEITKLCDGLKAALDKGFKQVRAVTA